MKIKVLGISGSPRHGNTDKMVLEALRGAEMEGAETEFVSFVNKEIKPCISCHKCQDNDGKCFVKDDWEEIYKKFRSSEAVVMGSPVYARNVTAQLKAYMDRQFSERKFLIKNEKPLMPYVGGAIAVGAGRHGGQEDTLHQIRVFLQKKGALVVGINSPHKQLGGTGHANSGGELD
jgi:multimeric flavodoxin WrbA